MHPDAPRPPRSSGNLRGGSKPAPAAAKPAPAAAKPDPSAAKPDSARAGRGSASSRTGRGGSAAKPSTGRGTPADRSGWLSGIRFSGFSLIMMGVLVLAVVVLAPTIAAFAQQRQQIAELRAAVSQQEDEVQRLRDERERWNDETFIVTQARERLYYVMPGEVSYLVIDDRTEAAKADAAAAVSAEVTESKGDWMRTLLDSVMTAGLAPASTTPAPTAPAEVPAGAPAEESDR